MEIVIRSKGGKVISMKGLVNPTAEWVRHMGKIRDTLEKENRLGKEEWISAQPQRGVDHSQHPMD